MEEILIFGASGHAKVVIDIIENQAKYKIVGIIDLDNGKKDFLGYPILGDESFLTNTKINKGIVAVGDNWKRSLVVNKIMDIKPSFGFVTAIHPSVIIGADVKIEAGCVVMAGVVINSGTSIGEHCTVNTSSSLDHDNNISDFASIAPGVHTGGWVVIGEYSALGIGATVIHNIQIGEHSVIGAGAAVVNNIPSNTVSVGVPSRVIKTREIGANYL